MRSNFAASQQPLCLDTFRVSTPVGIHSKQDVDGRDKSGHDEG